MVTCMSYDSFFSCSFFPVSCDDDSCYCPHNSPPLYQVGRVESFEVSKQLISFFQVDHDDKFNEGCTDVMPTRFKGKSNNNAYRSCLPISLHAPNNQLITFEGLPLYSLPVSKWWRRKSFHFPSPSSSICMSISLLSLPLIIQTHPESTAAAYRAQYFEGHISPGWYRSMWN